VVLLSLLLDSNLSYARELDCSLMEPDGPSQSEAVPNSPPLETRKSYLLARLESSIEVFESSMEVSQGFLGCTLRGFVHPWEFCLLQGVEEFVLSHCVSEPIIFLIVLVPCNPLF